MRGEKNSQNDVTVENNKNIRDKKFSEISVIFHHVRHTLKNKDELALLF